MTQSRAGLGTMAVVLVAVLSVLIPLAAILLAALQPAGTLAPTFSWPEDPQWGNFATAWTTAGFRSLLTSSAIIAVVVVPLAVVSSSLAGYALAALRFRGSWLIFGLLLAGLTLPYESIVIPLYFDFRTIGLIDTRWAVILPLAAAFLPFGVFWMRSHFESLPEELSEAAALDGAGRLRTLGHVLVPNSWPALTTLALLDFMWAWNHFLLALILLRDPTQRTAPSGLSVFVQQYGRDVPLLCAGTIIVILPIVVLYLVFQRRFVSGLLQGAVR